MSSNRLPCHSRNSRFLHLRETLHRCLGLPPCPCHHCARAHCQTSLRRPACPPRCNLVLATDARASPLALVTTALGLIARLLPTHRCVLPNRFSLVLARSCISSTNFGRSCIHAWIFLAATAFSIRFLHGIQTQLGVVDVVPLFEHTRPVVITVTSCHSMACRGLQLVQLRAHLIVSNGQAFQNKSMSCPNSPPCTCPTSCASAFFATCEEATCKMLRV